MVILLSYFTGSSDKLGVTCKSMCGKGSDTPGSAQMNQVKTYRMEGLVDSLYIDFSYLRTWFRL